jgi:integrase
VRPVRQAPTKVGRGLSAREVEALCAAIGEPWDTLVALLAYTGMRPGEALALRWADVRRAHATRRAGAEPMRRL